MALTGFGDSIYDGVRRIQEVQHEPTSGVPGGGGLLSMFTAGASPDLNWSETDYVYGPDYVDEFAFFINANGYPRYVLQDANCNAVVLARDDGVIVAQYTYGPYGDLRAADWKNPSSPATAAIGHQGLRTSQP